MDGIEEVEAQTIAPMMTSIMGMLEPVVETVTGYKAQLVSAGFSSEAADAMAAAVHNESVGMVFRMLREVTS